MANAFLFGCGRLVACVCDLFSKLALRLCRKSLVDQGLCVFRLYRLRHSHRDNGLAGEALSGDVFVSSYDYRLSSLDLRWCHLVFNADLAMCLHFNGQAFSGRSILQRFLGHVGVCDTRRTTSCCNQVIYLVVILSHFTLPPPLCPSGIVLRCECTPSFVVRPSFARNATRAAMQTDTPSNAQSFHLDHLYLLAQLPHC